ncbi:hypothetical protein AwWohl_08820 [Gammaproteobacteria bacterium]|nr:hypothetical protein AwWohl_08820 [Gammaproteobacteria bacterium]
MRINSKKNNTLNFKSILAAILAVMILSTYSAQAQSMQDIINGLTNPKMLDLNIDNIEKTSTPWGTFKRGKKDEDGALKFTAIKNNQLASMMFFQDAKKWLLVDLTVLLFEGDKACAANYKKLAAVAQKKLGKPNAIEKNNQQESGAFWQLKDHKEWGIWVATVTGLNPKNNQEECAVKATLAFGADEYLSEDSGF